MPTRHQCEAHRAEQLSANRWGNEAIARSAACRRRFERGPRRSVHDWFNANSRWYPQFKRTTPCRRVTPECRQGGGKRVPAHAPQQPRYAMVVSTGHRRRRTDDEPHCLVQR